MILAIVKYEMGALFPVYYQDTYIVWVLHVTKYQYPRSLGDRDLDSDAVASRL